jgi:hypothetical protein
LEKELELKAQQASRYESQIAEMRLGKSKMGGMGIGKPGPVLSRTGSVERSLEDQILKDLQVNLPYARTKSNRARLICRFVRILSLHF